MAKQPQPTSNGRKPTHRLYRVVGNGDNGIWTPIGAAWPNKVGMVYSIACDAVPLEGRLLMRTITERRDADGGQK